MLEINRFTRLRKILKISQKDMAAALRIPDSTISRYENNVIKPSYDILSKIANTYNINLNWLLTGKGEMFTDRESEIGVPCFTRKVMDNDYKSLSDREYIERVQDDLLILQAKIKKMNEVLLDLQTQIMELRKQRKQR